MRCSFLLFLAVLLLVLCFAPLASADTNFTLYQDDKCTQPLGEPAQIPFPSSTKCQTVPDQAVSFILYCGADGKNTNFSFSVWNSTTDCSGDPTISITSDSPAGTCAVASITFQGQTVPAYATISCSSSQMMNMKKEEKKEEEEEEDVMEVMEDVMEDVAEYVESSRVKMFRKPRTSNSIISLLKGKM